MNGLTLGVVGTSRKENERRMPLHPDHFHLVSESVRPRLIFERGYGEPLGVPDRALEERFGGVTSRESVLSDCNAVLLPKPMPDDLRDLREGGVLWGWPHCVQQQEMTQIAIERRQTLIAWESMFTWKGETREMHLFYRNNEMAGYCGVLHALELAGMDGFYGPPLQAVVLSLGSVSRGAVHALRGRGAEWITVYTQRPPWAVADKVPGCRYAQMVRGPGGAGIALDEDGSERSLAVVLGGADIIVNGILQDTDRPLMFLGPGEERKLKSGSLIVDVSCDLAMGFPFAIPTSFDTPALDIDGVTYYAVDHTPTYLWRSASWELSRVVVPFLETVIDGPPAWKSDETIRRAIEIQDGVILNRKILTFQDRANDYPHDVRG